MSRAVQEDLSDLPLCERAGKKWSNFKTWFYNSEDGTIMGDRSAKQWGQLTLYYAVFYLLLGGFTAIFFGVLGFMLPLRPVEYIEGVCSRSPNARDNCGTGPFFQIIDLSDVGSQGDAKETDGIYKFGLCEPGFVGIPRELNVRAAEPASGYSFDGGRKGYNLFTSEVNRVFCLGNMKSDFNPNCVAATSMINKNILPLIPRSTNTSDYLHTQADFAKAVNDLQDTTYTKPKPLFEVVANSKTYETYMVFLRFNKVWNYQPYANATSTTAATLELPIENNIGVSCALSSACASNDPGTGVNYKGEAVNCDGYTVSADKKITIEMLSNVMTNYDGFPWRGGALNMNFGSLAVTIEKGAALAEQTIQCHMGVSVTDGKNGVGVGGSSVSANAKTIVNMEKWAYAHAYTRSKGRHIVIPIS